MRRYETIFILRPNVGEDEVQRVIDYTKEIIIAEQGSIIDISKWGLKKLAYLIKKESLGYYCYVDYAATPGAVSEIERKFRIDDSVIKYMTVKTVNAISQEAITIAIEDASAAAAAAAEQAAKEAETESASEPSRTTEVAAE